MGICRPSILNKKYSVVWFLLKRFAAFPGVCPLHIISRNHLNTFLLIDTGKFPFPAICSEKEYTRKISFYKNKLLNCISCPKVCKISFCSKFPFIPEKWLRRKEEERELLFNMLFKQTQSITFITHIYLIRKFIG